MEKTLKENLTCKGKWMRAIFMIVYGVVNYFVQCVILALALIQFIFTLFIGNPNQNLQHFTEGLTAFSYHILRYLTYNVDEKPYPFSSWSGKERLVKKKEIKVQEPKA